MHPKVRRDLAFARRLDHVNTRRVAALPARSTLERWLQFPDRRVTRSADGIEREARPRLAPIALDLGPACAYGIRIPASLVTSADEVIE
jgi:hypothetical protein